MGGGGGYGVLILMNRTHEPQDISVGCKQIRTESDYTMSELLNGWDLKDTSLIESIF